MLTIFILCFVVPCLIVFVKSRQKVLFSTHNDISGQIEVRQNFRGEKLLYINQVLQGYSVDGPLNTSRYWCCIAVLISDHLNKSDDVGDKSVLMLGLGANTITHILARMNVECRMTIVEHDNTIIELYKQFFYSDNELTTSLIAGDIHELLLQGEFNEKQFEVVVIDFFVASLCELNSALEDVLISNVCRMLRKSGIAIFNLPIRVHNPKEAVAHLIRRCATYFGATYNVSVADDLGHRNVLIIAEKPILLDLCS